MVIERMLEIHGEISDGNSLNVSPEEWRSNNFIFDVSGRKIVLSNHDYVSMEEKQVKGRLCLNGTTD